jgi:hypothetical protein
VEFEAYTGQLLAETREELGRADNKASLLFAVFGVVNGALLAGLIAHNWRPEDLAAGATVVFWVGAACAAAGAAGLGFAVWPRITRKQPGGPASYYGDIVAYSKDRNALRAALAEGAEGTDRAVEQLAEISRTVWRKYQGIRFALVMFSVAAALCACVVIFG